MDFLVVWLDSDSRPHCASSRAATSGWLALYGGTGPSFFSAVSRYTLISPLPWPALVCPSSSLSLPLHLLSLPSLSPVLCHAPCTRLLRAFYIGVVGFCDDCLSGYRGLGRSSPGSAVAWIRFWPARSCLFTGWRVVRLSWIRE